MEKQFLKHLEQLDAEKKVTVDGYASFYHFIAKQTFMLNSIFVVNSRLISSLKFVDFFHHSLHYK